MTAPWMDEYVQMLKDCEDRESRLNDWERGFVDSVGKYIENGGSISGPQIETLEKIWERATKRG